MTHGPRPSWTNRVGFVLATAGFAIGLGNIWRFPFVTGMNGGGAFLLVYLVLCALIGIPLLTIEIGLGRHTQLTPIAGMLKLTGKGWHPFTFIAWFGVAAALLISSYYMMLVGWIVGYTVMVFGGRFAGATPEAVQATYESFTSSPVEVLMYTAVVITTMAAIVSRGLKAGIERLARFAMPLLFLLLIALSIRSMTYPGALEGLSWYLKPDFGAIDGEVVLAALGQAFYSIGIGMAATFALGSYLDRESSDVPGNAALIVAADVGVAVLAGLVMFPALFAFGLEPDAGPGLLFLTMTNLFARMTGGTIFGSLFFVLMIVAALTSIVGLFEGLVSTVTDVRPMPRKRATWGLAAVIYASTIPVILNHGPWRSFTVAGMDLFTLADSVSNYWLLPLGGLLMAIYVGRVWGFEAFREETNRGAGAFRIPRWWRPLIVWIIPPLVVLVMLNGLGVL
jgi:NSS family neurotransmitter:Na+ symporter